MIFYIELLIVIAIFLLFIFWFIWQQLSKKILERRYKPENDKGLKGEENRRRLIAEGKPDPQKSIITNAGLAESKESGILQTTKTDDVREADNSNGEAGRVNGKIGRKFRNPFKRG